MNRAYRAGKPVVVAVVLAVTLAWGSGSGWMPADAAPEDAHREDETWVGDVERHGRHYDYLGASCPIERMEDCPDYEVRYEIVPTTAQAARTLPKVAGRRARLIGHRELIRKPRHSGTLMVSEVQTKASASKRPPTDRVPADPPPSDPPPSDPPP
ncbi:MAG TPA: hypothetical protein VEG38_22655, partial [Acidimicrobiia bacterium]|nr:hypothetical protein [Acidimicrobiia bacterium]